MKNKILSIRSIGRMVACAAIGWVCLGTGNVCMAQTVPSDLSPDVQEVLTLSRQHMDDSVITNYINSTGKSYKLSADDIIYLNSQGVSQGVISALLRASSANTQNPAPAPSPETTSSSDTNAVSSPTPPPVDESSSQPTENSEASSSDESSQTPTPAPPESVPPTMGVPLQDNFFSDGGLNPSLWQTQSGVLSSLAAMEGSWVSPALAFSPSGMQMSGIGGPGQFMGIQSTAAYTPPFSFSATVSGLSQDAVPFEIYLVSSDLQQWLSIAGHLGGRGRPRSEVHIGIFGRFGGAGFGVPTGGGSSPDYGVWVNHTGSGFPISALGEKIFDHPIAGVPYTIQVGAGADGAAAVTLLDANGVVLAQESAPVGMGPFYVVLAGRDGATYAEWQSVQLTPQGPPAAVAAPPVPATPTLAYFQQQLAPYGNWVNVPGDGLCWEPAVGPGWRPYYDDGNWEYTDAGWYWQSGYPWGDITFHYGRWAYVNIAADPAWVWIPGYDYAPAWVVWRHDDADGYIGWAPLPPGAVFVNGGWVFNGAAVGVDFDFGLGAGFFTFVGYDHFWDHDYRRWVVPHDRVAFIFGHSAVQNHYQFDHGHFVDVGMGRDRIAALTHHDIHAAAVADIRHQEEVHNAMQRNDDVHNFHSGMQPHAFGGGNGPQHQGQNNPGHNGWGH